MGHALGLIHEQQRPDRGKYIQILWRNVQHRLYSAYAKEKSFTTDLMGLPYDLSSVMQYEIIVSWSPCLIFDNDDFTHWCVALSLAAALATDNQSRMTTTDVTIYSL